MINYNYYPEKKFIFTVLYGEVTPQQLHELVDQLQTIESVQGHMRGLVVLCKNSKAKNLKANDIMTIGERMKHVSFRKNGKNAIIAKSLLAYGLTRMYKVAADIFNLDEMKIYRENGLDDAIKWLDVTELNESIYQIIARCELIDR